MFSFSILDGSDQVSSQEEDTNSNNSNSPRFTQLNFQTTGLNSEKLDICKEEQPSIVNGQSTITFLRQKISVHF